MKKLLAFWVMVLWAQCAAAGAVFGTIDDMTGSATVTGQDGQTAGLSVGMRVYEGDTITSGHDGEVQIVTEDGGFMALRPDTVFRVDQYKADGGDDDKTFMSLLKGAVRSITGWIGKQNHAAYRLTTPTATVGIRGTDHEVTVVAAGGSDAPGTYDTVNEGETVLKTQQGEVVSKPGKFAFAPRGRAVAPFFLRARPHFLAGRHLRLEGRIAGRRDFLRGRLQQMRNDRIREFRQGRGQRPGAGMMRQRPGQRGAGAAQGRPGVHGGAMRGGGMREGRMGMGGRLGAGGMRGDRMQRAGRMGGRDRFGEGRGQRFGRFREGGAGEAGQGRGEMRRLGGGEGRRMGGGGARARGGFRRER